MYLKWSVRGPSPHPSLQDSPPTLLIRGGPSVAQAVTALAFTDDGAVLLSTGEDTVACAWLLMDVLDASPEQRASMQGLPTFQSWSARCSLALNFRAITFTSCLCSGLDYERVIRIAVALLGLSRWLFVGGCNPAIILQEKTCSLDTCSKQRSVAAAFLLQPSSSAHLGTSSTMSELAQGCLCLSCRNHSQTQAA